MLSQVQKRRFSRRMSRRSSSLTKMNDAIVSAELLAKLRKIDDERIEEERRVEMEAAMKEYFRKEDERRREQVTSIPITNLRRGASEISDLRKSTSWRSDIRKSEPGMPDQRKSPSLRSDIRKSASRMPDQGKSASLRSDIRKSASGMPNEVEISRIPDIRKGSSGRWLPDIHPNKSLFEVHVLMSYQEVMLTDSYTSPSSRGGTRTARFGQDASCS